MDKVILAAGSHVVDADGRLYELAEDAFALDTGVVADDDHEPHDHAADEPCGLCDGAEAEDFHGIFADKEKVSEALGEKKEVLDPGTILAGIAILKEILDLVAKLRERRNKK